MAQGQFPKPFEGNYPASLITAISSLVPFIIISTAYLLYRDDVAIQFHQTRTALEIIAGLATAGYAFGAMVGGDLIQRFRQRALFLICEAAFALSCVLAAVAPEIISYGAGRVLQGLATGLLLVIALPPVIQRFPPERMPITAAAINIGFFGAVTIGPLIGGLVGDTHAWRLFYAALAISGFAIFILALFTLPGAEPPNPGMPFDLTGVLLALAGTMLPFWAVGELSGPGFASPLFAAPLVTGLVAFVALIVVQYKKQEPLAPVKQMWHTFPLIGTLAAMAGGAAFVTILSLTEQLLQYVLQRPVLATGLSFWPMVPGVIISAVTLGALLRTRWLPLMILAGMLFLLGAGWLVMTNVEAPGPAVTIAAAAMLGLGAGATVAPGLNIAAFSLPSKIVGRVFALVELVRSVADYILAPLMLAGAQVASGGKTPNAHGIAEALGITLMVTAAATVFGIALHLLGGARLPKPDLNRWLKQNQPAIESPSLAESVREA